MKKFYLFILAWIPFFIVPVASQDIPGSDSLQVKTNTVDKLFGLADRVVEALSTDTWTFIPALTYSPETSLGLGGRALKIFRTSRGELTDTRPSSLPLTLLYTLNHQLIITGELELWMNENKSFLNSRIAFSDYPFQFSGIGNEITSAEYYATRYFYFHLYYEKMLGKGIYLGPRYEFRVDDIYDKTPGGLLEAGNIPGSNGQRLSGLGLALNIDRRDNIFQPGSGVYHQISWMKFHSFFGSNFDFSQWILDFRKYWPIKERQVLVGQARFSFTQGRAPFQHLSLIGGSDLMRGYFEGRYRDKHAMVYQLEWRFPVYQKLKMVGFGSIGQVGRSLKEFGVNPNLRFAGGVGFRYRLNDEGLHLRIDFAYGDQAAFYFGLNEVI
ncbi:BamA/TamA family outer membrane protein [Cyclobacterium plantarum]|uniref:BamA/TamA family outer membrane protein n=1 Tax=Cyclobacterium plantarum TaxID=2716263 RepID=A0ABX0HA49_9BACT|nr:BamA/TamA family outer membrane protein [Cyclobacterium plantarum]NHE57067.1 BamA/TamA family outer membrane protein [Cyclobacterium plantarum]